MCSRKWLGVTVAVVGLREAWLASGSPCDFPADPAAGSSAALCLIDPCQHCLKDNGRRKQINHKKHFGLYLHRHKDL